MSLPNVLTYDASHPLYGIGFSNDARHAHRVALTSFNTGPSNKLTIVDLAPQHQHQPSHQQGYGQQQHGQQGQQDFVQLASANLAFPATKVAWEPSSSIGRHDGGALLATTGDVLRIWELTSGDKDQTPASSRIGYGSRNGYETSYKLNERSVLSNSKQHICNLPPITSFSWNPTAPASIVTCSTDTTATLWDIHTSTALTQLIAHDRAVYDLSWLPQSAEIFVSVGADGSLRAFDLRQLEHSTILYETPNSAPLARIAFSNREQHQLACFSMDDSKTLILDMRSPGQPVAELLGHSAPLSAIAWGNGGSTVGESGGGWIASAGDDGQILIYDLTEKIPVEPKAKTSNGPYALSPAVGETPTRTPSPASNAVEYQPVRAWNAPSEINNIAYNRDGDWVGAVSGQRLSVVHQV